jgi:hypothetical protein
MDERDRDNEDLCRAGWPEAFNGGYDPRCCRFPKSCSVPEPVRGAYFPPPDPAALLALDPLVNPALFVSPMTMAEAEAFGAGVHVLDDEGEWALWSRSEGLWLAGAYAIGGPK